MNAQTALGIIIVGLLIAFGGASLASKYLSSDSDSGQIQVIMQDDELTPSQRIVLLQMVNLKNGIKGPEGYRQMAKYFNETAANFMNEAEKIRNLPEESNALKNNDESRWLTANFEKSMQLEMASRHFQTAAEACEKSDPDLKKIIVEVHTGFRYLEDADVDEKTVLPAAPSIAPAQDTTASEGSSSIAFLTTIVGLIVAALGAIAGAFQLKQSINEKNKAQLELVKLRESNAVPDQQKNAE